MIITPRLGFCCKYLPPDNNKEQARRFNVLTTTIAYLNRIGPVAAQEKIFELASHNLNAVMCQLAHITSRPLVERLHRLSSDILPCFTHPETRGFYTSPEMQRLLEDGFQRIGAFAREHGIRVGAHPAQFCVLATDNLKAQDNAIHDLEYHARMFEWMGYGEGWHPEGAHINIHGGARGPGLEAFRTGFARLSQTARNLVTVENDEVSYGLNDLLTLHDLLPVVVDLHHHWIKSRGEYLQPDDPRIEVIKQSWRDVRPLSHISVSREDLLPNHPVDQKPDFNTLLEGGLNPKDLRGHSDMMWNLAINDLVSAHMTWTDFEIEAKFKNLASEQIAAHYERYLQQLV